MENESLSSKLDRIRNDAGFQRLEQIAIESERVLNDALTEIQHRFPIEGKVWCTNAAGTVLPYTL